ncbi:MAG: outer membrane beta-barrel protein, partial [Chitinophagaceae bacterium]
YVVSFGPVFGLHGAYIFPSNFGVAVDLDYAGTTQKYTWKSGLNSYDVSDKLNYFEVPILLRKYSKGGGFYFELGPKFSFLTSAKESFESSSSSPFNHSDQNVKDGYSKMVISGAFGIGGQFAIAKNLYVDAGLRFAYGFTDATVSFSQMELTKKGAAGEVSLGENYAHITQSGGFDYKSTHAATGHVIIGLTYRISDGKEGAAVRKKKR